MKRETFLKRKQKISRRDDIKNPDSYRISVFRSNKYFYASLVENKTGNVLYSISSKEIRKKEANTAESIKVLAKNFCSSYDFSSIKTLNFDRGVYKYHGLVKIFVEEVRNSGVKI